MNLLCQSGYYVGSQIDVEAVEGRQWVPGGFVVLSVERSTGLLLNRPIQRHDPQPEAEPEEIPDVFAPPHHRSCYFLSVDRSPHSFSALLANLIFLSIPIVAHMLSEEEYALTLGIQKWKHLQD